jgi:hypothetical protein
VLRGLLWLLGLALPAGAQAQARPVVLALAADEAVSTDFADVVRVQLASTAELRIGGTVGPGGLDARIASASAAAEREGAVFAFWCDRSAATLGGAVTATLHVVGRGPDLALVRVVRVSSAPGPELDRALALKLAELLDTLVPAALASSAAAALAEPLAAATAELAPAVLPPPQGDRWRLALEVGAIGAIGAPVETLQAGARLGAGVRWSTAPASLELLAAGQLLSPARWARAQGSVEVLEVEALATLRALASVHPSVQLGGLVELGARFAEARALASDGRAAGAARAIGVAAAAVELRVVAMSVLDVVLDIGVTIATVATRWAIDGEVVLDQGHLRPLARLSIVIAVP